MEDDSGIAWDKLITIIFVVVSIIVLMLLVFLVFALPMLKD